MSLTTGHLEDIDDKIERQCQTRVPTYILSVQRLALLEIEIEYCICHMTNKWFSRSAAIFGLLRLFTPRDILNVHAERRLLRVAEREMPKHDPFRSLPDKKITPRQNNNFLI